MAEIIIKKTVNLSFLGEEYADSKLVFKAIPISEYKKMINQAPDDNNKAVDFILSILKERFLSGVFNGQEVTSENLSDFDAETITECFMLLTGQKTDPKV